MMNRVVRQLMTVVVALTLISVFAPIQSSTASGAGALAISDMWCENFNGGRIFCRVVATGGSGTYSYTWQGIKNAILKPSYSAWVSGTCQSNSSSTVRITVQDSTGATVSHDESFPCN